MDHKDRIDQKLRNNTAFTNLEEHYLHIKESTHNAALEDLGRFWWDEEIEEGVEEENEKMSIIIKFQKKRKSKQRIEIP